MLFQASEEPESLFDKWSGSFDLGVTAISGNNTSTTSTFRSDAKLEEDGYRWLLGAQYSGVRQTEAATGTASTTSRLYTGSIEHHRTFGEGDDFYAYGKGSGRSDVPNGLQGRTDGGLGIGYTFRFCEDKTHLNLEGGPSMVWENNVGAFPTNTWTARLAARFDSALSDDLSLTSKAEYFRSVGDAQDASATGEVGLRWTFKSTWFLQLSSSVSWDGTPAAGFENSDYRQALTVGTTF